MLSYTYAVVYTAASVLSLSIMYLFTVYYVNLAQSVRVNCYVGYAAVEQNGVHLCRFWNVPFFQDHSCSVALVQVSYQKCGSNAFASVGENFVAYANIVDLYVTIETSCIIISLVALWVFYLKPRTFQFALIIIKLALGGACAMSILIFTATMNAMTNLSTDANSNVNQKVYWGWGFILACCWPYIALLIHSTIGLYVSP
jgi:hypothetical protein